MLLLMYFPNQQQCPDNTYDYNQLFGCSLHDRDTPHSHRRNLLMLKLLEPFEYAPFEELKNDENTWFHPLYCLCKFLLYHIYHNPNLLHGNKRVSVVHYTTIVSLFQKHPKEIPDLKSHCIRNHTYVLIQNYDQIHVPCEGQKHINVDLFYSALHSQ